MLDKWSATLPGVPIMICGFLDKEIACDVKSNPPTKTHVFNPIPDPNISKCWFIWRHNSLVGANIQAKKKIIWRI